MLGNHLLGIYEKALPTNLSWNERLSEAKALGLDYVEISIDEKDFRIERLFWKPSRVEELRRISYDHQVPIRSMCLSAHRRYPFGSADKATRDMAHEVMERAVDLAGHLGVRVIQLAGYDVYYEESTPESVALFKEGMEWASELAEKSQIMLGMEIMDTPFMNSITKHMAYEERIKSPWYKLYPDIGNLSAWPENEPYNELRLGSSSIVAVHLKDTIAPTADKPGVFKQVPFGKGCVDFPRSFKTLEEIGYRGPFMIEMWGENLPRNTAVAEINSAIEWLSEQYRIGTERK